MNLLATDRLRSEVGVNGRRKHVMAKLPNQLCDHHVCESEYNELI